MNIDNENFDNDDLIIIQFDSQEINLYYSQLVKYSKRVREHINFTDINNLLPKEIQNFQQEHQISFDNLNLFFKLLSQNFESKEETRLTYIECVEILKISNFFQVRKLSHFINKYIKEHDIDIDFILQMIQYEYEMSNKESSKEYDEYEGINVEIENYLSTKIIELLSNEKFSELPISIIYRIIQKSSIKRNDSYLLFKFIKKKISKFCVLFSFFDICELSDENLSEICEFYSNLNETERKYFEYMKSGMSIISEMNERKKRIEEEYSRTKKNNQNLENQINELQQQLTEKEEEKKRIQKRLEESEEAKNQIQQKFIESENEKNQIQQKFIESENEKNQIQQKFIESENEKNLLQEKLDEETFPIKGQIIASVKNNLLISAQIKLMTIKSSLDTSRSKYIISTSDSKKIELKEYEKGEPITSLEMNTVEFLCKAGRYCIRCLIFDSEGKTAELVSTPVMTRESSAIFEYEGKARRISLFKGQYKLEVWGAKGGDSEGKRYEGSPGHGGFGGYSRGILTLNENSTIYAVVGGEGRPGQSSEGSITEGGFPDGGGTKTGHQGSKYKSVPGTGGGSTSIRIKDDTNFSRVIVAGGGGGASGSDYFTNDGGFGGGHKGGNCSYGDSLSNQGSGTQTGSTSGLGWGSNGDPGEFGHGATGKYNEGSDSGGGGGGGWYGGGSGGYSLNTDNWVSSGGGGSGWTFTESNFNEWRSGDPSNSSKFNLNFSYYLTDAQSVDGDNEFPSPNGKDIERGHKGNGYAKITPL